MFGWGLPMDKPGIQALAETIRNIPGCLCPRTIMDGSSARTGPVPTTADGAVNRSDCGRFAEAHHRLLCCHACKAPLFEFRGTPLSDSERPHGRRVRRAFSRPQ